MKKCPHHLVQYCPLYAAGHTVGLATCMDKWDFDGCDVEHGRRDYGRLLADLSRQDPGLIAERANAEYQAEAKEQRSRNMRAAGLH